MVFSHHLVYLILVLATCSKHTCVLATQYQDHRGNGYFRNFPCPNAEDIDPCICTYLEDIDVLDLKCTNIEDEQELYDIFHSAIPIPQFRKLSLKSYNLETLSDTVFGDVTFEDVHIEYSGTLTSVGPKTFMKSASTLSYLWLANNELSDFPFETLSQYTQLEAFSFAGNPVPYFPVIKSESLRSLFLNYNAYHNIPDGALDGLPNLEYFYAGGNDTHTMAPGLFMSLPKLRSIAIDNTVLTHLESQQFGVSSTDIFVIDLRANQIATVDAGAFTGVQSATIYLMDNKLTVLPEATWRPVIDARVQLYLQGNDLLCGCDVAWLVLEPLYHEQVADAVCHSGELLVDLDPHNFDLC